MLQHPVGTELEERLGPNLLDLHLHSAARYCADDKCAKRTLICEKVTLYFTLLLLTGKKNESTDMTSTNVNDVWTLYLTSRLPVFSSGAEWTAGYCQGSPGLGYMHVLGRSPLSHFWQKALPFPGKLYVPSGIIYWWHLGSLHQHNLWPKRRL